MSRIGRLPVKIPNGVNIDVDDKKVRVKGPKGELVTDLVDNVVLNIDDNTIIVKRTKDSRKVKAFHGLMRAIINNMVVGVTEGFSKRLDIVGVGYRANMKGKNLELSLGYSHPIVVNPPEGIEFKLLSPQKIEIKGFDKQKVGETAAMIRNIRKPDPYKGKGVRYEGEHIVLKQGKAAK
ncbi:MAG: 50S ribosomal protein L6 [Deferribacterota bacterium]|nr:50S ribosomal protein L6 [Deferribacterota bacterium]